MDEEIGLLGAAAIDLSMITGKKLINIDSEDDSQILTSCAGGQFLEVKLPLKYELNHGKEYKLELKGLLGGHSGAEIHKERGNANVLMGRILLAIRECADIVEIQGGNAHNVIPSQCVAVVKVDAAKEASMKGLLEEVIQNIQSEYHISDGGVYLEVIPCSDSERKALDKGTQEAVVNALVNLPNGIQHMSSAIPGLVETSLNLGVLTMSEQTMVMKYNIRSSVESAKEYLSARLTAMVNMMGGRVEIHGDYPGWEYRVESELRDTVVKVYTKVMGKEPHIGAIHAGLECGLLCSKIEDLDCVSIGPNLREIHSFNERMEVSSVERIWELLLGVLEIKLIK